MVRKLREWWRQPSVEDAEYRIYVENVMARKVAFKEFAEKYPNATPRQLVEAWEALSI